MAWKTINGTAYSYNGNVRTGYTYWVTIDYTQNISANTSSVTVKHYIKSNGSWTTTSSQWVGTITGTAGSTLSFSCAPSSGNHLLGTKTFTVNHNSDGTGSFSLSASYTNGLTSESAYTTKKGSISTQTVTLPTIPRASSIGTISGTTIGGSMTVNFSRASTSFTHNVRLVFGSYNSTISTGGGTSATFTLPLDLLAQIAGKTSGTGTIYVQTKNGSSNIGSEVSKSVTLSAPTSSIGSYSGSTTIGSSLTVNVTRSNSNITHRIWLAYGSTNVEITGGSYVATSQAYTLPMSLCEQTKTNTSGTGTVTVKAYWKNASNTYYQVGTNLTKSITLTVPSTVVPTYTFALSVVNGLPSSTTTAVAGRSQIKATISSANGAYGSTISSYSISGQGISTTSSSATSSTINTANTYTYTAVVKDSRGRSVTKTASVKVESYTPPSISSLTATRCNSDGTSSSTGTYIKASFKGTVLDVGGVAKNAKTYKVEYKTSSATTWTTWTSGTLSAYGGATTSISAKSGFATNTSYNVRVSVTDSYNTVYSIATVGTSTCAFNVEPSGIGIGKYYEKGGLDVKGDIHSSNAIYIPHGNAYRSYNVDGSGTDLIRLNSNSNLVLGGSNTAGNLIYYHSGTARNVYHTGYKPSPADIGAFASSGGTISGDVTMATGKALNFTVSGDKARIYATGDSDGVANRCRLVLECGDDDGDMVTIRSNHWEKGAKNLASFNYTTAYIATNLVQESGYISLGSDGECVLREGGSSGARFMGITTPTGTFELGSRNTNNCHMYTDRTALFVNKNLNHNTTGTGDLGTTSYRWRTLYCTTAINTSDSRTKENITPLNGFATLSMTTANSELYNFFRDMPLYTYNYKDMGVGDFQTGYLADEIMELNPKMASRFIYEGDKEYIDADTGETVIVENPILMTSSHSYTANMHLALQETMRKVDRLDSENIELRAQVSDLEERVAKLEELLLGSLQK